MTAEKEKATKYPFLFLLGFICLFGANLILPKGFLGFNSYTQRMWFLCDIMGIMLSIYLTAKNGLPSIKMIVCAVCLAIAAGFYNILVGVTTFITFIGAWSVFEKMGAPVLVLHKPSLNAFLISIFTGIAAGAVLGIVNLYLGGGPQPPSFQIQYFLYALNPGIYEEITFRLFFYALIIYWHRGKALTKKENIFCVFFMVAPHVLIHFPDMFFMPGSFIDVAGNIAINAVFLCLLFGLPFAVLQRKRDLTAAMAAHTTVDLLRFIFLGLPG